MRPLSRPDPVLDLSAMQTYAINRPTATHRRPATCAEVECVNYVRGWVTRVPRGSELVDMVASLRHRYRFREIDSGDPAVRAFEFEPGQACLRHDEHTVAVDRPPLYVVRGGDWRASTGLIRRHHNGSEWVEDFAEHQDRLSHEILGTP